MRHRTILATLLTTLAIATACSDETNPATTQATSTTNTTAPGNAPDTTTTTAPIQIDTDIAIGDCLADNTTDDGTVNITVIECDPTSPVVFALPDIPDATDTYPGEDALLTQGDRLCTDNAPPDLTGRLGHASPTPAMWDNNQRYIICVDVP